MALGQIQKYSLSACGLFALLLSALPAGAATLCDSLAAGRYDIVYVCPAAWRTQVARLAIHRSQAGFGAYSSIVATLEGVAPCYGTGRLGVRSLLDHAIQSWTVPPKHVVIVGAYRNSDTATFVVPTWFIADPTIGFWTPFVPTDDPYVFAPGSADSLPVVSIGRIPVWSLTDLTTYIDKVIAYETSTAAWKQYALHVVEDRDLEGNSGTIARDHADSLTNYFSWRYAYNFYRSNLFATQTNLTIVNQAVIPPWNAGLGFAFFYGTTGHNRNYAFFQQNSDCESPVIYNCTQFPCSIDDSLHTNGYTPVVFAMTCGNGYSGMIPGSPSTCGNFSNYLLATPGKGAVVLTGPARALHETPGYAVAREWFTATFGPGEPSTSEPGEVLRRVKANLMLSDLRRFKNEFLQMTVLGDPALRFFVGIEPVIGVAGPPSTRPLVQFSIRPLRTPARELAYTGDFPEAGAYGFRVFDILGRQVSATTFTVARPTVGAVVRVPDKGISSGIYFIVARKGSLVSTAKLVLVR